MNEDWRTVVARLRASVVPGQPKDEVGHALGVLTLLEEILERLDTMQDVPDAIMPSSVWAKAKKGKKK